MKCRTRLIILGTLWWVVVLLTISLLIGIAGYYYFARSGLVDSLLNASMILGSMGPVYILPNNEAKIFAAFYALNTIPEWYLMSSLHS